MIRRLTSSSLAGTLRKLVAVGTSRLASMLATMRAAAPRIGLRPPGPRSVAARRLRLGDRRGGAAGGCAAPALERPRAPAAGGGAVTCGGGVAPVVGEEVLPALAHRRRVGQVLLVHLVDEPRVGAEGAREQLAIDVGIVSHGVERTGASIHH